MIDLAALSALVTAARKNHGTDCRTWKAMPAALVSSSCAECGCSSTAHVVTKLCDVIEDFSRDAETLQTIREQQEGLRLTLDWLLHEGLESSALAIVLTLLESSAETADASAPAPRGEET